MPSGFGLGSSSGGCGDCRGHERARGEAGPAVAYLTVARLHDPPHAVGTAHQVGGDKRQYQRAYRRGDRGQVQVGRRQLAGRIGMGGDGSARAAAHQVRTSPEVNSSKRAGQSHR